MIFDFRMSIFNLSGLPSRNSRFSCGYRDRRKLIRFLEDWVNACRIHKFCRNNHLKPKAGFIRFFLDHTCFVDEVRSGFRPTKSAIISRNRTSAPDNLICYCVSAAGRRQDIRDPQDSQRKGFGSFFHFMFIHARF
jgi:hypothetical protein